MLILVHLNAIFQHAQKSIRVTQLIYRIVVDDVLPWEGIKAVEDLRALQLMVAAAFQYLKRLHEKLDFTNAARTDFDIDAHTLRSGLRIDLSLERGQPLEHTIIVIAAIYKRF